MNVTNAFVPSSSSRDAWPMKTVTKCKGRERIADARNTHKFTPQTAKSAVTTKV